MISDKERVLRRLRRVEGQLRGVQRMIEEDKPCEEVLVQLEATRRALSSACAQVITCYLQERIGADEGCTEAMRRIVELLVEINPVARPEET